MFCQKTMPMVLARPQTLYSVVFRRGDVWAVSAHPHDELVLDMWQSYLEEA